jgi:DNA mismatch endonuclease (patch repair protein)
MVNELPSSQRSALMSRIGSRNTVPELAIRSMLWHEGFRFRLHAKNLPGCPDIVLPKWRAAVFVHGCFWHAHEDCARFRIPATRTSFWRSKLSLNRQRDAREIGNLQMAGWRVAVIWECAIRESPQSLRAELTRWLQQRDSFVQFSGIRGSLIEGPISQASR